MSKFLSPLRIEKIEPTVEDGHAMWRLLEPLLYQSDVAKRTITVPAGFETDLASVPRMPLMYMLTGDTSHEAAAVHDYLYKSHEVERNIADAVLREASQATGVYGWRRWLMWAGVRMGGASHWNPPAPIAPGVDTPYIG